MGENPQKNRAEAEEELGKERRNKIYEEQHRSWGRTAEDELRQEQEDEQGSRAE